LAATIIDAPQTGMNVQKIPEEHVVVRQQTSTERCARKPYRVGRWRAAGNGTLT